MKEEVSGEANEKVKEEMKERKKREKEKEKVKQTEILIKAKNKKQFQIRFREDFHADNLI